MLTFTIWCVGISIICAIHPYIPTCQAVSERKSILSARHHMRGPASGALARWLRIGK
jgi:hypothetical protein